MDGRFVFFFLLIMYLEVFSAPSYRLFPVKDEWYYTRPFNFSLSKIVNVKHHKLNYTRYFLKMMKGRHEEIVREMGNAKEIKRSWGKK